MGLAKNIEVLEEQLANAMEKEEAYEQTIEEMKEWNGNIQAENEELLDQEKLLQDQYFSLEEQLAELNQQIETDRVNEVIAQSARIPTSARTSMWGNSALKSAKY